MENTETTVPSESTETSETSEQQQPDMVVEGSEEVQPETLYADKFKSVGDLEKSYQELQSTFSKKLGAFEGAPEDGYQLSEEVVITDQEVPLVEMLQEWGQEHQLSNDGLNSLAKQYAEYQDQHRERQLTEEYKKLGGDADARVENIRSFLEANLGEETTQQLATGLTTAGSIEAVEKLISLTKQAAPAPANATTNVTKEALEAMRFAVDDNGNRKMEDPKYRAKVLALEAQLKK